MNILFRCDGSIEIGMGHVVRCLALAGELSQNHNSNITFAMRASKLGIEKVNKIYPVLISKEIKNAFNYEKWIIKCINKSNAKILVLDVRDGLSREELKRIKNATGIKVVTIDDPEDKRIESDLAFYPPVPQLEKTNWDEFNGDLYIGWEYSILRKEFSKAHPKPNNPIPNILVSMGGSDPQNMVNFVVDALDLIENPFTTTIILGPGYQFFDELANRLKHVNYRCQLLINPKNIAHEMAQSDLAIISFGQTAYELATLGVPAVYLCLSSDHVESSKLFENEGLGTSLGKFKSLARPKFVETIQNRLVDAKHSFSNTNKSNKLNISDINTISSLIIG